MAMEGRLSTEELMANGPAQVKLAVMTSGTVDQVAGSVDTWAALDVDQLADQLAETPPREIQSLVAQAATVTNDYQRRMIASSELPGRIADYLDRMAGGARMAAARDGADVPEHVQSVMRGGR